jgi:hypothetical protein
MSGAKLNVVFTPQNLWEPGLPAMTAGHSEYLLSDTPLSRAGSLLQLSGAELNVVFTPQNLWE